ncbi:MAG TPA: ADOP family duplicated permease [Gemmatimonadaceae bacterium]|nr:ADOP family duplicated permease [Gemmatimonadaceae bacterium]
MRLRLNQQRLLELLGSSSLSQNHWALKLGLARGHWSEIVNGKHPYPSARTRTRMLEEFKVPMEELFTIEVGIDPLAGTDFRRAIADRYLIDAELGQGGMGAVYLARDVRHGRVVAVKVISPEAVSGIGLTQFQREISTVAQLHHPNILPLYDSGEAAGHPFYVMPWVRGGSLRARLRASTRLSLAETLRLLQGMAAGLAHAHGERVLHCDVKPENVLLHGDHAWMMDFGIARKLHSEVLEWPHRESLDISAGTPAYVSPEQAAGERDLDARSDVYSLACLTFEMLSGRTPFHGTNTQEIVSRRFIVPPPPLADFAPGVPAGVAATLERAMALPREQRPPSTTAFCTELEDAARTGPRRLAGATLAATRVVARLTSAGGVPRRRRTRTPLGGLVRDLFSDLVHTFRGIRRAPGFAAIVVVTLGLALGANATMFGIVDRLLLRPPPHIVAPERVQRVNVARWFDGLRPPGPSLSYPAFQDLRDRSTAFAAVAAFNAAGMSYGLGARGQEVAAVHATGRYFQVLGARPALGRFFGDEEDRMPRGQPVAVLGHAFWRAAFGGDSGVIGRTMLLDGRRFEVIGVAPESFTGTELTRVDVWLPLTATIGEEIPRWVESRGWQSFRVIVRLRDGVNPAAANEDAERAYHEGHANYHISEARAVASLSPLIAGFDGGSIAGRNARVSAWLLGMAVIVLLIACANVANLMLARGLTRSGEVAVRRALGGSGGRLVRQFFTESLMLAMLGCAAGLALAYWAAGAVRAVLLPGLTWDTPPVDVRVLAATAAATVLAALVAGVLPLVRGARSDLATALQGAARSRIGHPRRLLASLLLVQTALAAVLLVGAGLFVRSLQRVQSLDLGFAPDQLLYVDANLDRLEMGTSEITAFHRAAEARLRATPGVEAAGVAVGAPFLTNYAQSIRTPGVDSIPRQPGGGPYYFRLGAGAMEALNVRVLRGRALTADDDRPGAVPSVVVTERMAGALWPGRDPLAQCLAVEAGPCAPVVGVVADLHRQGLQERPFFLFFVPLAAIDPDHAPEILLVRVTGRPEHMVETVRRELLALREDLPYVRIDPYEALISPQARSWRLGATMFTAFGVLSLLMAAIGVYGVLSFSVTQRAPELGIRSALGASPAAVLRLVLVGGVGIAGAGVLLGTGAAFALAHRIEPLLFETSARAPAAYAAAGAVLLLLSLLASLLPGLRAARTDPLVALRS